MAVASGSSSSSTQAGSRADPVARVTWSAGDSAPGARGTVVQFCLGSSVPLITCVRHGVWHWQLEVQLRA